jgi:hypothetical protein
VIVEIDGARFEVPDDATLEEIDALSAPAPEKIGKGEAAFRALSSIGTGGMGTKTFGLRPASRMSGFSEHGALGPDEDRRRKLMEGQQKRDAEALKQHPVVSLLAGAPAAALSMPFGAAARAPTLLGRAGLRNSAICPATSPATRWSAPLRARCFRRAARRRARAGTRSGAQWCRGCNPSR